MATEAVQWSINIAFQNKQSCSSISTGVILGSFFYGYICLQIPGGWLSTKFGGKRLFGMAIFLASLLALITPFVVRWNVYVFIALRVTQGLVLVSVNFCCIRYGMASQ